MTPLQSLVTALIRLLGLYFAIRAVDNAAAYLFTMVMQAAATPQDPDLQLPSPWAIFLTMVAFYLALAAAIFFAAPKIARLMTGPEVDRDAEVPWHETLIFCTGGLIIAWAFVRLTDTVHQVVAAANNNAGQYTLDNAMMVYLVLTAILLGAGIIMIAKFPRISAWISARRTISGRG